MKKYILALALLLGGCDQWAAKNVGGSYTLNLPCGQKLVNITWKETNIWTLTRNMYPTDVPETYTFKENSTTGIMEGVVIIKECKN